jgi:hypothetical protein
MPIVAPIRFPNLQSMMDLFRSSINDDGGGQDGPQDGLIATNSAPFTLPFLNNAIKWVYRSLRNIGDPALIIDNYLLLGIPALTGPNPAVQVSLGLLGYFDGFAMNSQWTLPAGAMGIDRAWERVSGTEGDFHQLREAADGLQPIQQTSTMRQYEWRGNAMWMPGAVESVDLRLRCKISLPSFQGTSLDFSTTYVPIFDCEDAIVDRMLVRYARRFSPEQLADAKAASAESIFELQQETVRQSQRKQNRRADWGEEAVGNFAGWNNDL